MSQLTVFREIEARALARSPRVTIGPLRIMIRMTAVPNGRCRTVLLTPAGDATPCRMVVSDTGWDACLKVDRRMVALMHCPDRHHVQRRCSTLAPIWVAPHTELPASR